MLPGFFCTAVATQSRLPNNGVLILAMSKKFAFEKEIIIINIKRYD
jgi:hypothetical protein